MKIELFDYLLPEELIAQHGLNQRDQSRLMVMNRADGKLAHTYFYHLSEFLQAGDLLILNNTRVVPARIRALTERKHDPVELVVLKKLTETQFECMVKPGKRMPLNAEILVPTHAKDGLTGVVRYILPSGYRVIEFRGVPNPEAALYAVGEIPLPPYIKRTVTPDDQTRYQTIYGSVNGSIAAPTAGLHFTHSMLTGLKEKGIGIAYLTLHVSTGTFRPVKTEEIENHPMDEESFFISKAVIAQILETKQNGGKIIAVGTTSVRALETVFSQIKRQDQVLQDYSGRTRIFIYPPYQFKIVDALITNFHLPCSTLLMLVSALGGREKVLSAYQEAVRLGYRFYSYGDAMLII